MGAWRDDKKHGHGTFTWVNGDSYAGAWRNGKKHGHGTHAWADGSSYEGAWHEDAIFFPSGAKDSSPYDVLVIYLYVYKRTCRLGEELYIIRDNFGHGCLSL